MEKEGKYRRQKEKRGEEKNRRRKGKGGETNSKRDSNPAPTTCMHGRSFVYPPRHRLRLYYSYLLSKSRFS